MSDTHMKRREWTHLGMPEGIAGNRGLPVDSWEYTLDDEPSDLNAGRGRLLWLDLFRERTSEVSWAGYFRAYVVPCASGGPFHRLDATSLDAAKIEALRRVGGTA